MKDIDINFGNGHMNVHLDQFFPTTLSNFRKLLKTIDFDREHKAEIKASLQDFFEEEIRKYESGLNVNMQLHYDAQQRVSETSELVETSKYPNGVRLTDEQLEQAKRDLRNCQLASRRHKSRAKEQKRDRDYYNKCLSLMEKARGAE